MNKKKGLRALLLALATALLILIWWGWQRSGLALLGAGFGLC